MNGNKSGSIVKLKVVSKIFIWQLSHMLHFFHHMQAKLYSYFLSDTDSNRQHPKTTLKRAPNMENKCVICNAQYHCAS